MKSQLLIKLQICLLLILLGQSALKVLVVQADVSIVAKSGCRGTCGNVSIPFPFGIGIGCFHDQWYEVECKQSTDYSNGSTTSKPFLSKFDNIEIMEINTDSYGDYGEPPSLVVKIPYLKVCTDSGKHPQQQSSINLTGSPYYFSEIDNVFIMEGCPGSAVLLDESKNSVAGCGTVCNNNNNNSNSLLRTTNRCYGVQCCQTRLKDYLSFYQIELNLQNSGESKQCFGATLMKSDSVNQYAGKLSSSDPASTAPVALYWIWMENLIADRSSNFYCMPFGNGPNGSFCRCNNGLDGNPYVSDGCRVPDVCKHCRGYCAPRYDANGIHRIPHAYYCRKKPPALAPILGLSISFGVVLLVIAIYGLYRFIKRRRELKRRAKFFKRNGGLLLQQQLLSNEGLLEKTKVFTIGELDKATDHFNDNRILGQGGQGTVYKGMLIDGKIVAIKKAKLLDENQLEQFINEVVILSQINHRNVVKMLGCCLETEVPLLVYEFVPNGTLSEHIHDPDEDFVISWEMRLKMAVDSASAIAYLHSSSSIPIYHRDIKSSNILLDEKHRAKVSDFGSSKTIAVDQTHLTTLVQGTMGYLDPEYFQSYQFTEKSDVYSFGVVLLEILTSKNPIYRDASTMEQKNLVTEFLFLTQNFGLSSILDPEIVKQAKEEELIVVVELAKRCVNWSGKLRPKMKDVAMTLEMIIKSPAQASTWYQQAFAVPREGVDENSVSNTSEAGFMTSPLPSSAYSPLYIDQQPLLPDTI